jgi:hypothetical protein
MDTVSEVIGNKKYVGSVNTNLNSRIILDQPNKIMYENNLFLNISQVTQFDNEKNSANTFRMYGKIDPIYCFDVYNKTTAGFQKINLDKSLFDLNLKNWSIVVLRSVPTPIKNASGMDVNIKGVKVINNKSSSGTTKFYLDLTNGLPAKTYFNGLKAKNVGLFFPLGHNFKTGDKVSVKSKNAFLPSGVYNVIEVSLNKIIIDYPNNYRVLLNQQSQDQTQNAVAVNLRDTINKGSNSGGIVKKITETPSFSIRNLKLKSDDVPDIINKSRPKIYPFVEPEYTVAKVMEKEQLEYYIKSLEVIDVIGEVDDCGFSLNNYKTQIKNWFSGLDLDLSNYRNHLNEPLSELYIGIIKNGSINSTYSNVESHFDRYIEFVEIGDGVEQITNNNKPGQVVKMGDRFLHSICEYSTEQLTETEIIYFKHRFIHKDVLFSYKPFYTKPIKLKSLYIESSDSISGIPDYSVYSRKEQKWIWREYYDIGITNEDGLLIDFPFTNGAFYAHSDIKFFVNPEKRLTKKYTLNVNDITSKDGSQFITEFTDILDNLGLETNIDTEKIKPFTKFKDKRC